MRNWSSFVSVGTAFAVAALVIGACSSSTDRSGFTSTEGDASVEASLGLGGDGGACSGLACQVPTCSPGATTSITGKVFDPAGANPLYNVLVYIPSDPTADLPALTQGATCDTCAAVAVNPFVATLTDTKGAFELDNVPVGKGIPVVIQVGKWRRKLSFDVDNSCAPNVVTDTDFRLPKNGTEGDMPQIAVTTGGCDALECLLRGIGVDESEFVPGAGGTGHIHVFNGDLGEFPGAPNAGGTDADRFGGQLWNDVTLMTPYDIILMSCECDENLQNKGGAVGLPGARQAMWDYANAGGRIFGTHYHYSWFKYSPQPDWQAIASWPEDGTGDDGLYDVDQSFPKGASMAEWLVNVNASSTLGSVDLEGVTGALSSVNAPAQSWIKKGDDQVRYFSFNTPTAADPTMQCGRAVYGDLHLMGDSFTGSGSFPDSCPSPGGLEAQQKALEFMFFDLSNCLQSDTTAPTVPH